MRPFAAIIVLNWNGWHDTIGCLESLFAITYRSYAIVIVDNGSTDDSLHQIRKFCQQKNNDHNSHGLIHFEEHATGDPPLPVPSQEDAFHPAITTVLLKNEKNEGYAGGNNTGIRYAVQRFDPTYILVLNNDTVVSPDFLTELLNVAEICPKGGFFGPKTYYFDDIGGKNILNYVGERVIMGMVRQIHTGNGKVDSFRSFNTVKPVDFIPGSCVLARRAVIDSAGPLNPDFFLYWEDVDWCYRGRRFGYDSIYVPKSVIWHKVGSSNIGYTSYYYYIRNRFLFSRENAKKWQQCIFLLYFFSVELWISGFSQLVYYRSVKRLFALYRGLNDGMAYFIHPGTRQYGQSRQ